ncbi:MAG: ImmA/IrrE family metallo-endopeptidase [Fluviicola sp.]
MSNVQKGNKFEQRALQIVYDALNSDEFSVNPKHAQVFQKKKYHSPIRNGMIEFDISIEVTNPNAANYSLLYLIECKSYSSRIPVDEVETFHSQVIQLGKHNVKGVFITDAPLQKGGEEICKRLGIMHIQADMNGLYDIVLYRESTRTKGNFNIPFVLKQTEPNEEAKSLINKIDKQLYSAFSKHITDNRVSYGINRLSKQDIEASANQILDSIDPDLRKYGRILSESSLISYMEKNYKVSFVESRSPNFLGKCDFENNRISLNHELYKKRRRFFVLAHECGHYILHSKLSIGSNQLEILEDNDYNFRVHNYRLNTPKDWIEWQANQFAQSLVLHQGSFSTKLVGAIKRTYGLKKVNGPIVINDDPSTHATLNELVESMSYIFNVSKTSIFIKIKQMGMLKDLSRTKKIGEVFGQAFDSFMK